MDTLQGPNICIADSGSLQHSTPYSMGLSDVREATLEDSLKIGDGKIIKASKVATIRGKVCNKYGNEVESVALHEVKIVPGNAFNLFSVMKMINKGWTLMGNKMHMELERDGKRIVFDLVIPIKNGLLFSIYPKRSEEAANLFSKFRNIEQMVSKSSSQS